MPTKSAMTAAVGSAAAVTVTLLAGATTSAHAQPTCRGQEATIVGSPDRYTLRGTSGPDVIVTNGSEQVRAFGDDDVVCVTGGARFPYVNGNAGDDVIDATGHNGGEGQADLGRGSDRFIGSARRDVVNPGYRSAGDHDRVSTRRGADEIHVPVQYAGTLDASGGRGNDQFYTAASRGMLRVGGGPGRDTVRSTCTSHIDARKCTTLKVSLDTGVLRRDGVKRARARGFEDVDLYLVPRSIVEGTKMRNVVRLDTCSGLVHGGPGRDDINHHRWQMQSCPTRRMRFYGQGGDDVLRGSRGPDRLYGGKGRDLADGRAGRDVCRAERKKACEA